MEFTKEEIEDLADLNIADRRIFALLAIVTPFIDFKHHHFHIDHVFPKSLFTRKRLGEAGFTDEQIEQMIDRVNRIGNLQLLEGQINLEKKAKMPAEWIQTVYVSDMERENYRKQYLLGNVPEDLAGFMEFYKSRRERLQHHIDELINLV